MNQNVYVVKLRRPLTLRRSAIESRGIDLTSKKDFMKKYLFLFENEPIKVENSYFFSDFAEIPLVLVVNYNGKQWGKSTNQWDLSKITKKSMKKYFDRLVLEQK